MGIIIYFNNNINCIFSPDAYELNAVCVRVFYMADHVQLHYNKLANCRINITLMTNTAIAVTDKKEMHGS